MSNRQLLRNLETINLDYSLSQDARTLAARIHGAVYGDDNFQSVVNSDKVLVKKKGSSKHTTMSFTKLVEYLRKNDHISDRYLDALPPLATRWGERFKAKNYTFTVVAGDDLVDAYVNGPHSCMAGEGNSNRIQFYAKNGVELVKILEDGKYMGRALLWTVEEYGTGQTYKALDRVYPSDGGIHATAVREWATEKGYLTRPNDSAGSTNFQDAQQRMLNIIWKPQVLEGHSPYFDTFRSYGWDGRDFFFFAGDLGNSISLKAQGSSEFSFDDATPHAGWIRTDARNKMFNVWDGVDTFEGLVARDTLTEMLETEDGFVFPENIIYCNYSGKRVHVKNTTMVDVRNRTELVVSSEFVVHHPNSVPYRSARHFIGNWVEITGGMYKGFFNVYSDLVNRDGKLYGIDSRTLEEIRRVVRDREDAVWVCLHRRDSSAPTMYTVADWFTCEFPNNYKPITDNVCVSNRNAERFCLRVNLQNYVQVWDEFVEVIRAKHPEYFARSLCPVTSADSTDVASETNLAVASD